MLRKCLETRAADGKEAYPLTEALQPHMAFTTRYSFLVPRIAKDPVNTEDIAVHRERMLETIS